MAVIKPRSEKKAQALKPETPAKIMKIIDAIGRGIPYEIAAVANGMHPSHIYNIINQGLVDLSVGDDTIHARAVEAIKAKEQNDIDSCLNDIREKDKGHKGAEWILERRFWKHFSSNVPAIEIQKELDELKKQLAEKDKIKGN